MATSEGGARKAVLWIDESRHDFPQREAADDRREVGEAARGAEDAARSLGRRRGSGMSSATRPVGACVSCVIRSTISAWLPSISAAISDFDLDTSAGRAARWPAAGARSARATIALTRPGRADITTTRSARYTASLIWWVMKTAVLFRRVPHAQQFGLHQLARLGVECGERFVEQDHFGIDDERAREVDALLHAAREFARMAVFEAGEADQLDHRLRARNRLAQRHALELETVGHVAHDGAPRHQRGALEDHRPVAAGCGDLAAVDQDAAARRGVQTVEAMQQRRLAAAAGPDDADELAGSDRQGRALERNGFAAAAPLVASRRRRRTRSGPTVPRVGKFSSACYPTAGGSGFLAQNRIRVMQL